ncbi:MAG: cytochrome b N-terminal domain-containing protein, partial [Candidatus Bipolaricaulota bacterium]|nr:cytochrome b N-terminal domain-containing protein [Candidatus Bipolaricaulota bacterium]MDW8141757.1 cytochrome b N-terminal domain-containing protein [Candidatus Bipolaricaulota bacterium]
LLFVITIMLAFSGYILPWDQLGYYAAKIASNIADGTPFIGVYVKQMLLGGDDLWQPSLLRWYVIHVYILPALLVFLVAFHFWRIRKDDYSKPYWTEERKRR